MSKKHSPRIYFLLIGILFIALPLMVFSSQHKQKFRQYAAGNTTTFTPTAIPISDPEIANPMRGGYPTGGLMNPSDWSTTDSYDRFDWADFETSQGNYNLSSMENRLAAAKTHGRKWGFRIMAANSSRGGNSSAVPQYLIRMMPKGFWFTYPGNSYQTYAPDWNDANFLDRVQALLTAISNKFGADPRLGWVEIGIYGDWSEWHVWQYPYPALTGATDMTTANKQKLIQMYISTFPNKLIIMPIDEAGVIAWVMNTYPSVGIRRDCLGNADFINKNMAPYLSSFQDRWKTAPWITESCYMSSGSGNFERAATQVPQYHIAMISGHNMQSYNSISSTEQQALQMAYKGSGYRFVVDSVNIPATIAPGETFSVNTSWSNIGVTPAYTSWNVMFQLRNSIGAIAWQQKSSLSLQTLLPTGNTPQTIFDTFTLPATVTNGAYTLSLQITDPTNYYRPLALAIQGRQTEGSYPLGTVTISGS